MKIHYISASFLPSRNANSIHVMKMCQAFAANGHNVILFGHDTDNQRDDNEIYSYYGVQKSFALKLIKRLPVKALWNVFYTLQILKSLKSMEQPDYFYGRYIYALSSISRVFSSIPVIYEAHALPQNFIQKHVESSLFKAKNFAHLVVISQVLKDDYLKEFPFLSADQILVAHDGAEIPNNPTPAMPSGSKKKAGYSGKLTHGKGMGLIAALVPLCPDIEFHIFGGSPRDVEKWRGQILHDNIVFHGHIPHGQLDKHYAAMDIMLAPLQEKNVVSRGYDIGRWTSPLKIFEYMAHAKPMIVSDLPVLREIVEHEKTGLLVPPGDPKAWADAIQNILTDDALRETISNGARKTLEASYTWSVRAQNILKVML